MRRRRSQARSRDVPTNSPGSTTRAHDGSRTPPGLARPINERAELAARHADNVDPEPKVTAAEWLAAHRVAVAPTRGATARSSTPRSGTRPWTGDRVIAEKARTDGDRSRSVVEQPDRDIREVAPHEPRPLVEDDVRVPSRTRRPLRSTALSGPWPRFAREGADAAADEEHRAERLGQ